MKQVIFYAVTEAGKQILIGYGWNQSDITVILPENVTLRISDNEDFFHTLEIMKQFLKQRIELDVTMGEEEIRIQEKVKKEEEDDEIDGGENVTEEEKKEVASDPSKSKKVNDLSESKPLARGVLTEMVQKAFLSNPEKSYTKVELAKELQVKLSSLSSIFYNLEQRGVIQRIERGKYQLVFQRNEKESDEKTTDSEENPQNDGKNQNIREIGEDTQSEDDLKKEVITMISKLTGKDTTQDVAAETKEGIPQKATSEERPKEETSQEVASEGETKGITSQETTSKEETKGDALQENTSSKGLQEKESKKETKKVFAPNPKEEMIKEFLENYQGFVDYILTRKTFMVKSAKRRFSEQEVVDVIKAFDNEVIHYHPSQEGIYFVSPKWRVWYYLLKKNSAEEEGTIQYDLQLTQKETTKAITQAMQENLIRDVTGKKDRFEKYSI